MDDDDRGPPPEPWNDSRPDNPEQTELIAGPTVAAPDAPDVLATLSQYARAFGVHYETLRRCLLEHSVAPAGRVRGHAVYTLRAVYRALTAGADVTIDPDRLSPMQQRAYWQARNERQRYEVARGRLVDVVDVEQTMGQLFQILVRGLETLPDRAERDRGIDAQTLAWLDGQIGRIREELYAAVMEATTRPAAAPADVEIEPPRATPASKQTEASAPRSAPTGGALEQAIEWLETALADGPRPAAELVAAAAQDGISEATLRRAKRELGIKAIRDRKGWAWTR